MGTRQCLPGNAEVIAFCRFFLNASQSIRFYEQQLQYSVCERTATITEDFVAYASTKLSSKYNQTRRHTYLLCGHV